MTTILVTGGAGFIGYHLTTSLLNDGYKVVVVDDLSSGRSDHISDKVNFVQLNLADKQLGEVFSYNEISYVFHLAGQTNVPQSMTFPLKDASANILGTVNLLEKCQAFKIKKVIYLSGGAAVYGEDGCRGSEESLLRPISPLGLSKVVGEQYLELARRTSGVDYTILRCANVYGPHQDPYRDVGVVASFCQFMINNHSPTIYGDGQQTRDFLYINDVITALKQTLIEGSGEIVNVGSGESISIQELFNRIKKLTDFNGEPYYRPERRGEVKQFAMKVEKAKNVLKWRAKVSLEEGLKQTIAYYQEADAEV